MKITHTEAQAIVDVLAGKRPVAALAALAARAREEFPMPGDFLRAVARSEVVTPVARRSAQELLETIDNVLEYHAMLVFNEEQRDAGHAQHARRQLDAWIESLRDAIGNDDDEEAAAEEPAPARPSDEHREVEEVATQAPDDDAGELRNLLTPEELALAEKIRENTGRWPSLTGRNEGKGPWTCTFTVSGEERSITTPTREGSLDTALRYLMSAGAKAVSDVAR